MAAKIREDELSKALAAIEDAIEKSNASLGGTPEMPSSTQEANGALGQEGDTSELALKALDAYIEKAVSGSDSDSEDDDEEEEDEDSDMDKSLDTDDRYGRESISDMVKSDTGASEVLDCMPFLDSVLNSVSDSERALRKSVQQLSEEQGQANVQICKAVAATCKMVLEVKKSLDTLMASPAGQRRTQLAKGMQQEQRFEGEGGPRFTRDDVLKGMIDLVDAKKITPIDVARYETGGIMTDQVKGHVTRYLNKSIA